MQSPITDKQAAVAVSVFGPVQAAVGNTPVKFTSLRSAHLLGYLIIHETRPRSPTAVAEDLWPEVAPDRSRKALNTELWRLRTAFETAGAPAPVTRDEVALQVTAGCRSDFHTFWSVADDVPLDTQYEPEAILRAEAGIDAARGVLMEGCYDDWLLIPREMSVAELNRRLSKLMDACMAANRFGRAIRAALKMIELDPLLEAPHRVIMRAHGQLGNRAAALRQFQTLKAMLARELQVPPLEETIALYTSIVGGTGGEPKGGQTRKDEMREVDACDDVIQDLLQVEKHVRRVRHKLSDAARIALRPA